MIKLRLEYKICKDCKRPCFLRTKELIDYSQKELKILFKLMGTRQELIECPL